MSSIPNYYDGPAEVLGNIRLRQRFFSWKVDGGWISGKTFNVAWTVDAMAAEVWPYFKDFNLWQNSYGHYYSAILGDIEGQMCRLSDKPNEPGPHQYRVARVIPEHLIVLFQTIPEFNSEETSSPDCHVFLLNGHPGAKCTEISALMEHHALFKNVTEEQALRPWQEFAPESHRKFRDIFIPTLNSLVAGSK